MVIVNDKICAFLALAAVLAGCTAGEISPIEPKLSAENACYAAPDPVRCRMAHDKAGGYPIEVVGTDR